MKEWKFGVSTVESSPEGVLLLQGSIEENLRTAAKLGYSAIEIHMREEVEPDYASVKAVMEETGVAIAQIVTGKLNTEGMCSLMDDRPYVSAAALAGMKKYVDIASQLGANIVVGWVKGNVPAGKAPDKYMERLAANLRILNDYAKPKNVKLNIEVINHYEVNVFTTAKAVVEFLEKYQLDNCYAHLDTFHMQLEEDNMADAIRTAKDHLGYFHIADSQRWYPGSGEMNYVPIFQALEEVGYDGYVTVECFRRGDGVGTAKKAIEYLKNLKY